MAVLERLLSDRLAIPVVKLGDATDKITESSTFQELPLLIRTMAEAWIAFVEVAGICAVNLTFELIDRSSEVEATDRIPTAETVDFL